jgi:hypothetical protein
MLNGMITITYIQRGFFVWLTFSAVLISSYFFWVAYAEAQYARSVTTGSLSSRVVDEVPIPVLFVPLQALRPDFGDPRGGGTREHEGQDIFAVTGTPIVSPTKAVVTSVGEGESAGKYVYTANPGGETFRYMHLDATAKLRRGDRLNPGDFIGTLGYSGNASEDSPHLHFEIRENRTALDPFPRLTTVFTLEEQVSFLEEVLDEVSNRSEYMEFLIEAYGTELRTALNAGYDIPRPLEQAMAKAGIVSTRDLQAQLNTLIDSIPLVITRDLSEGAQGAEVALLQIYLQFRGEGIAVDALRGAGITGYYGPITTAAVMAYQTTHNLAPTGTFDSATRNRMRTEASETPVLTSR